MKSHQAVIVADPPWRFGDALGKRGASAHYQTLTVEQIKTHSPYCDVAQCIAPNALLFLWRVASMQLEAFEVAKAWGFDIKAEIVWEKTTSSGKAHFGMGHYVRASHEVCLIGVRGRPTLLSRSIRSRFAAPVGRHSEKPELFYEIVESLATGPYVEFFARRRRPGWVCMGDQLPPQHVVLPKAPKTLRLVQAANDNGEAG